jgi:photosystem I P700 chlorophyll a apoprotein A2
MLSDISHHHLSLSILIWVGGLLQAKAAHQHGLYLRAYSSIALSLSLFACGVAAGVASQHLYSLPSFSALSYDFVTSSSLYLHHSWIAGIAMLASFSHLAIYLIRDYTHSHARSTSILPILANKSSVLSSLTYVSIYLGCHTLGVYVHNDTCMSFACPSGTLQLDPVLSQLIQEFLGKHLSNTSNTLAHLPSFNKSVSSFLYLIGPGDLYAHHSIAVGLHVTTLILLKGCLDSRFSHHYPDKIQQHYAFSCDGPSRGGTCDVSSWDSFYLSSFWVLNTLAWISFYFHWKHLTLSTSSPSLFDTLSLYLNGWFRDYLWFNSSSLIRGYDAYGANDLSVWSWIFLGAHLLFATGFMFLISWRGY